MRRVVPVVALVLAGCAGVLPGGTPNDATAMFRPTSMIAERETVAPGEVVELTYPDQMVRGVMFVLEQETGSGWAYRYLLLAPEGAGDPEWFEPDDAPAVPDIGITGPGPDRVVIPDVAEPGSWRICTGNAGENVCVRIEIAEP